MLLSSKIPAKPAHIDGMACTYSVFVNPPIEYVPEIYHSCVLWLSTSLNEGFGLTTLEAMACGCPVVWINSYGLQEFLKHEHNCLITKNNKGHIIDAARILLDNKQIRKQVITNGYKTAALFRWKTTANNFRRVLDKICK
jgi:glycosyltransferase involved in cell wall biosynthesis